MQRVTFVLRVTTSLAQRLRNAGLLLLMFALLVAVSGPAAAAPERGPKVYLMRGFMNVFSLGLDDLSRKLDARGIRSEVYNHSSWNRVVGEITQEYKSGKTPKIVIIGHSSGGGAVVSMVEALGQAGVPVALAVTLDIPSAPINGGRVGTFLNLYSGTGALTAGKGFRGRLVNKEISKENPGIGHMTIDKADVIHNMVLRYITSAVGGGAPRRQTQPAQATLPGSRS